MAEAAWLGIADSARAFRDGTSSPVAHTEALLARIERLNPALHAFLHVDGDGALAQAREAERELAAGHDRGPLHGVAIALKDIVDVAGQRTTCHSAIEQPAAARDAAVVAKLREAGAVLIGKTALHEFATGGPAFDLPWPPARNPWDTTRHPGGSSSGSGAAVAAGLVAATLGTDTGGSVRNPATCCGVLGLKPTYGLIDRDGVFPLAFSLDHVGMLARSAEDIAIVLDATATPRTSAPNGYLPGLHEDAARGIAGLRIGVVEHFHTEDQQADPAVVRGLDAAVEVLRTLDADVQPVRLPSLAHWSACGRVIQQAEQYAVHQGWLRERPQDYCALSRTKLVAGAFLDAGEYVQALQTRRVLCGQFNQAMQSFDALVAVSGMTLPCAIEDAEAVARTYERHARMPFNVTGTPALAVPVGFSDGGLPLGIQIATRAWDERMALRIAAAYEAATGWKERRPPV